VGKRSRDAARVFAKAEGADFADDAEPIPRCLTDRRKASGFSDDHSKRC